MEKPIILIGGTAGTGKTSFARNICTYFNIDHRLGTGFIREIVKSQMNHPDLQSFTFDADDPIMNLTSQSQSLYSAVKACIKRAKLEGTSLVIEGPHLIPALYHNDMVDIFIILAAPEKEEHFKRITGPTHLLRNITEKDFTNARLIDEFLQSESNKYNVPYLVATKNSDTLITFIQKRLDSTLS